MPIGLTFWTRPLLTTLGALTLAAVIVVAPVGGARAADDGGAGGLLNDALQTMGLKTTVGKTPDFVEATHPASSTLKFIPTGTPHLKRPIPVKSVDDIAAKKAALDAAQAAQLQPKAVAKPMKKPKLAKPKQTATDN